MLDIGVTKLAIIGGIALVVIGPEKLPGLARTAGTLLGRVRRYVADVKDEVNRSMELEELRKVKDTMQSAAQEVEKSIQASASELQSGWSEVTETAHSTLAADLAALQMPSYKHPGKKWRLKQGATPQWYKVRNGVRMHAQSGAARVARHRRPQRLS